MSLSKAHRKTSPEMPNRCANASEEECMGAVCLSSPLPPFHLLCFHLVPTSAKLQTGELHEMWDLISVSAVGALHWSLPGYVKFSFTSPNIYFKVEELCWGILGRFLLKNWSTLTKIIKIGNLRSNLYLHWKSNPITTPEVCSQSKSCCLYSQFATLFKVQLFFPNLFLKRLKKVEYF